MGWLACTIKATQEAEIIRSDTGTLSHTHLNRAEDLWLTREQSLVPHPAGPIQTPGRGCYLNSWDFQARFLDAMDAKKPFDDTVTWLRGREQQLLSYLQVLQTRLFPPPSPPHLQVPVVPCPVRTDWRNSHSCLFLAPLLFPSSVLYFGCVPNQSFLL